RYPTAGELAADLGRFAGGEPVSVRAAGVVERVAKWARRKPTLAAAYTLGLLAGLLGGVGGGGGGAGGGGRRGGGGRGGRGRGGVRKRPGRKPNENGTGRTPPEARPRRPGTGRSRPGSNWPPSNTGGRLRWPIRSGEKPTSQPAWPCSIAPGQTFAGGSGDTS